MSKNAVEVVEIDPQTLFGEGANNVCEVCETPTPGMHLCYEHWLAIANENPASSPPESQSGKR